MAASVLVNRDTVQSRVFRKNFAYLEDGLNGKLEAIIPLLYQNDIIIRDCRDKVIKSQRTLDLLVAVESQVKTNQTAFSTFIGVLNSVPPLKHLAEKLQGDYDHMSNPPLDSCSAEIPSKPAGQQLHALLEADSDPADWPLASRDGAIAGPPPLATVRPSENGSVPSDSETKPSVHTPVQFFISPTPETSQNFSSSIVGAPQPPPIVDDMQCMRPPRHSVSVPSPDGAQLASITQPEFQREFKSKLDNLREFVVASYSQKEQEVEEQSAEVAQTKSQVLKTSKELLHLANQLEKAEQRCKGYEAEISQRCEGYEAEISGYREELKQVESQHMKEKEHLESQLSLKMADHKGMALVACQLAKRCDELELTLKTERVEHEDSKQELRNAEDEIVSLKLEKEVEVRQMEAEISSLKQELKRINSGFSKKQAEIQKKILKKKSISRSRINSATQQCLDIKAQMKQSVSQLDVFTDSQDPELKKLIHDIQHLFSVYDKQKRSVSWPSGLCKLQLL